MNLGQGSISSIILLPPIATEKLLFKENAVDFKILSGTPGLWKYDFISLVVAKVLISSPGDGETGLNFHSKAILSIRG